MVNTGRRARNRAARNRQITEAASAILTERGIDALTMQEVADRVDCAVGTIYTYFSSKSALLSALQLDAIRALGESHDAAAARWDDYFEEHDTDPQLAAVIRLLGITRLMLSWPELQPREFEFLQLLITATGQVIHPDDAQRVLPQALTLFAEARVAVDALVELEVVGFEPDRPGDDSQSRTMRWVAATEGAYMVANATKFVANLDPDAFDRHLMGMRSATDLIRAWGADPELVATAVATLDEMDAEGMLLPESI